MPASRRHVHTRTVRADVYARDDGLWDVEAELVDTKGRDFALATGVRREGEPIHHMRLTLTIDTSFEVLEARAQSLAAPYPGDCQAAEPLYRQLVGLNLMKDFRRDVRARLGGVAGCTHLTELAGVLPTAAVQAFAGEVIRTDPASGQQPWQLGRCQALRLDGPAVAKYYPRWSTAPDTEPAESR